MTALVLQITDVGRAAMVDPAGGTRTVHIVEAGLTQAAFVAAPTLEALPGEFKRIDTVSGLAVAPDTVHLTLRDSGTDSYAVRGIALYLDDGTLFAVFGQPDPILEKAAAATFYLAIDWTLAAADVAAITFGDTSFLNPPATETVSGVAQLATIAEALAGAVGDKIITPAVMAEVLAGYVNAAQLGAASGVATLGADGKLAVDQRPAIDLIDVWPVADQAAMLAKADATVGDFAVRADSGLVYVLQALPPSTLANWLEITTPSPVGSVNGKVGAVVLSSGDVGAVPSGRKVQTGGGLLSGGGTLAGDLTLTLNPASATEAAAGVAGDKVVTPASLATILATLAAKANGAATVSAGGLLTGGGVLAGNPTINLAAASAAEILAGNEGGKAVTPAGLAGLPKSLTPNGYWTLPGGLKLMWVQVRQVVTTERVLTVAYPDSFAAFVVPISLTGWNTVFSISRDLWCQFVGDPGLSSCTIQTQSDDGQDMRLDGFNAFFLGV
ncbi:MULTISPECIES: hypothetical protein [unclassified Novosphingobium]|uniref:hypothetical protein n=1 Tax=unclassified Novosphingobium TaxID=2644732 RepID=UPI000D324FF8|nr:MULTISPECIES: hypothetical protein [unclassified Novosphingobium]PTR08920.1 hypothetical protein C8K11_110183 [Novosphingobium sp. GV055]PUB01832.1 hypothetical protein C8K12_110183 [Novosphingobium sp. GV061]PUB17804.1 hypothetical protein C8K14_110183 [Novosphingobium sp. GV079]PUB40498.1 hypothetical protein C8K10_110183 [Novosphingobium sp. GV027]